MCKGALDTEADDDDDEDLVSCIAGWSKLEPTVQPAASPPRDAVPQPLEPASSAVPSAVGDDEAESSAAASGDAASTPTPAASGGHAKSHTKGKRAPKKGMRPLKRGAPSTAPVQDGSPKRPNTPEFAASRPPTPLNTGAHAYAALPQRVTTPMPPPTFETTRLSRRRIATPPATPASAEPPTTSRGLPVRAAARPCASSAPRRVVATVEEGLSHSRRPRATPASGGGGGGANVSRGASVATRPATSAGLGAHGPEQPRTLSVTEGQVTSRQI